MPSSKEYLLPPPATATAPKRPSSSSTPSRPSNNEDTTLESLSTGKRILLACMLAILLSLVYLITVAGVHGAIEEFYKLFPGSQRMTLRFSKDAVDYIFPDMSLIMFK